MVPGERETEGFVKQRMDILKRVSLLIMFYTFLKCLRYLFFFYIFKNVFKNPGYLVKIITNLLIDFQIFFQVKDP